jgi:hypothetical protein
MYPKQNPRKSLRGGYVRSNRRSSRKQLGGKYRSSRKQLGGKYRSSRKQLGGKYRSSRKQRGGKYRSSRKQRGGMERTRSPSPEPLRLQDKTYEWTGSEFPWTRERRDLAAELGEPLPNFSEQHETTRQDIIDMERDNVKTKMREVQEHLENINDMRRDAQINGLLQQFGVMRSSVAGVLSGVGETVGPLAETALGMGTNLMGNLGETALDMGTNLMGNLGETALNRVGIPLLSVANERLRDSTPQGDPAWVGARGRLEQIERYKRPRRE